jgi:protoporphyrinogen oxidase
LEIGNYDAVIVTLPSFAFLKLAPQLPKQYQESLMQLKGLGAVVVVMRLRNQFFKDNTYLLNVCDTNAPVLAVVEHTNLIGSSHYNNEHIVYLGNYLPKEHKYFSMGEKDLINIRSVP